MKVPEKFEQIINSQRYNVADATLLASDEYWDGSNFERQGRNRFLYVTETGAYFTVSMTQWPGEQDALEPVSMASAIELYEGPLPEHEVEYEEAFPDVEVKAPQPLSASPDEQTPRQFKLQMTDGEYAAVMEALTPERRRDVWLTEAARITGHRLAVKISRATAVDACVWFADNEQGLAAVIESDTDLAGWIERLIHLHSGPDEQIEIRIYDVDVIIRGSNSVIDVVYEQIAN